MNILSCGSGFLQKLTKHCFSLVGFLYGFATAATETASKLKESVDDKLEKVSFFTFIVVHKENPVVQHYTAEMKPSFTQLHSRKQVKAF